MARDITADALEVIATGGRYTTKATLTPPGGSATVVNISPGWSVSEKGPIAGPRLGVSSLTLLPTDGIDDLFAAAGYPGSVYNLSIGIVLGADTEWVPVFSGYVAEGSSRREALGVTVSLTDAWQWVDKVPFDGEYATTVGVSRANSVAEIFAPVVDGLTTLIEADGGYIGAAGVYTGPRGQAAAAIARDGLLQAGFNGSGELVVKAQPDYTGATLTPDWRFHSNQSSSLNVPAAPTDPATVIDGTLERSRAWTDALINAVIVKPGGSEQTWTAQTARLADTSDPRHQDNVGFRPFEITSDTIENKCDAMTLAQNELTRRLRVSDEKVKLQVLLNPAIEADDIFWVSALPTLDDAGWNGTYVATSVTHSPSQGTTSIEGVSAAGYTLGT